MSANSITLSSSVVPGALPEAVNMGPPHSALDVFEIVLHIFGWLSADALGSCAKVNNFFAATAKHEPLWNSLLKQDFPDVSCSWVESSRLNYMGARAIQNASRGVYKRSFFDPKILWDGVSKDGNILFGHQEDTVVLFDLRRRKRVECKVEEPGACIVNIMEAGNGFLCIDINVSGRSSFKVLDVEKKSFVFNKNCKVHAVCHLKEDRIAVVDTTHKRRVTVFNLKTGSDCFYFDHKGEQDIQSVYETKLGKVVTCSKFDICTWNLNSSDAGLGVFSPIYYEADFLETQEGEIVFLDQNHQQVIVINTNLNCKKMISFNDFMPRFCFIKPSFIETGKNKVVVPVVAFDGSISNCLVVDIPSGRCRLDSLPIFKYDQWLSTDPCRQFFMMIEKNAIRFRSLKGKNIEVLPGMSFYKSELNDARNLCLETFRFSGVSKLVLVFKNKTAALVDFGVSTDNALRAMAREFARLHLHHDEMKKWFDEIMEPFHGLSPEDQKELSSFVRSQYDNNRIYYEGNVKHFLGSRALSFQKKAEGIRAHRNPAPWSLAGRPKGDREKLLPCEEKLEKDLFELSNLSMKNLESIGHACLIPADQFTNPGGYVNGYNMVRDQFMRLPEAIRCQIYEYMKEIEDPFSEKGDRVSRRTCFEINQGDTVTDEERAKAIEFYLDNKSKEKKLAHVTQRLQSNDPTSTSALQCLWLLGLFEQSDYSENLSVGLEFLRKVGIQTFLDLSHLGIRPTSIREIEKLLEELKKVSTRTDLDQNDFGTFQSTVRPLVSNLNGGCHEILGLMDLAKKDMEKIEHEHAFLDDKIQGSSMGEILGNYNALRAELDELRQQLETALESPNGIKALFTSEGQRKLTKLLTSLTSLPDLEKKRQMVLLQVYLTQPGLLGRWTDLRKANPSTTVCSIDIPMAECYNVGK